MVTKQQQFEWLAKKFDAWPGFAGIPIKMSINDLGRIELATNAHHKITSQEWQQERDKMQQKCNESECGVMTLDEAIDHANEKSRELEGVCAENHRLLAHWLTKYRDTLSKDNKPAPDNSWHERGEFPPVGCECEIKHENGEGWIKAKVVSITSEYAILVNQGSAGEYPARLSKTKFRPVDYEKTLFVSGVIDMVACGLISHESAKELAMSMFDAGYRKVKP